MVWMPGFAEMKVTSAAGKNIFGATATLVNVKRKNTSFCLWQATHLGLH